MTGQQRSGTSGSHIWEIGCLSLIVIGVVYFAVTLITQQPITQREHMQNLIRLEHSHCQMMGRASDDAMERLGTTDCSFIRDLYREAERGE
jgi:hypothetical protein